MKCDRPAIDNLGSFNNREVHRRKNLKTLLIRPCRGNVTSLATKNKGGRRFIPILICPESRIDLVRLAFKDAYSFLWQMPTIVMDWNEFDFTVFI